MNKKQELLHRIILALQGLKRETTHFNKDENVICKLIRDIEDACLKWPRMYYPGFVSVSYKVKDTRMILDKTKDDKDPKWSCNDISCELMGLWYSELYGTSKVSGYLYDRIKDDCISYKRRNDSKYFYKRLPQQKNKIMKNDELTESVIDLKDSVVWIKKTANVFGERSAINFTEIYERLELIEKYINEKDPEANVGIQEED